MINRLGRLTTNVVPLHNTRFHPVERFETPAASIVSGNEMRHRPNWDSNFFGPANYRLAARAPQTSVLRHRGDLCLIQLLFDLIYQLVWGTSELDDDRVLVRFGFF